MRYHSARGSVMTDRPALKAEDEIEVTREMVEAGERALGAAMFEIDTYEDIVTDILTRMAAASPAFEPLKTRRRLRQGA